MKRDEMDEVDSCRRRFGEYSAEAAGSGELLQEVMPLFQGVAVTAQLSHPIHNSFRLTPSDTAVRLDDDLVA
jgi:hypothetical protein